MSPYARVADARGLRSIMSPYARVADARGLRALGALFRRETRPRSGSEPPRGER